LTVNASQFPFYLKWLNTIKNIQIIDKKLQFVKYSRYLNKFQLQIQKFTSKKEIVDFIQHQDEIRQSKYINKQIFDFLAKSFYKNKKIDIKFKIRKNKKNRRAYPCQVKYLIFVCLFLFFFLMLFDLILIISFIIFCFCIYYLFVIYLFISVLSVWLLISFIIFFYFQLIFQIQIYFFFLQFFKYQERIRSISKRNKEQIYIFKLLFFQNAFFQERCDDLQR
ncbi:transmembrane protein, putative, partial (macronuclear) [Tetrahymena thermophila SB210]